MVRTLVFVNLFLAGLYVCGAAYAWWTGRHIEFGAEALGFPLFVNVALFAIFCGQRVTASAPSLRWRNRVGWLGLPLFVAGVASGTAFRSPSGNGSTWSGYAIVSLGVALAFFGLGMVSRHIRKRIFVPRSLAAKERAAAKRAEQQAKTRR
jgi:hypothetical protein